LLDWDGVLADSRAVFTSVFLEACHRCGFFALDAPGRLMALFDDNMYAVMQALGLRRDQLGRILKDFKRDTLARLNEVRLFDGIPAALEAMAANNVVAIVTSNLREIPLRVLERDGIRCVAEVLGVEAGASKVEKIRHSMARHPARPAYYVGDTKGDMLEGKTAGAMTIAVTWGWHEEGRLREGHPDFMVGSPGELAALFKESAGDCPAAGSTQRVDV